MNSKTHRLVWNAVTAAWVAVGEHVRSRSKRSVGCTAASPLLAVLLLALAAQQAAAQAGAAPAPTALPSGGQVLAGQAGIAEQGATMTVTQTSPRAAIDWATFNVGSQAQLNFVQPSGSAVTLNRVQGGSPSQIFGRITANGQVFLSNPNGVYFAPGASVDVGGLVATTHRIGLDEFMAGKAVFERHGATGSVVNEGELKAALGGYIALLAPEVRNQGVILARLGTVALAAGETFELQFDSNHTLASLRVAPATVRALVDNRSAVLAPGGLVILSAQAVDRVQGGVVRNSGRIEATGLAQRGGRIVLDASERIENAGTLDVSATAQGPAGSIALRAPEVLNDGALLAAGSGPQGAGGAVQLQAGNLMQGAAALVDASGPAQGGTVELRASGSVVLAGRITAAATADTAVPAGTADTPLAPAQGGSITVQAAQTMLRAARIDASGERGGQVVLDSSAAAAAPAAPLAPLPAPEPGRLALTGATQINTRGRRGSGGGITLLGDDIALQDTTALDASGASGGGSVRVGGGWQGGDGLYQATRVTLDSDARIDVSASGGNTGDGGTAVLWSDVTRDTSLTTAAGRIDARGALHGSGGRVETSGHAVDTSGLRVDAQAGSGGGGNAGLWLVDPYNYTINNAAATAIATTLNTGTNVTVTTATAGNSSWGGSSNAGDAGDITVTATIAKTGGAEATLTLLAHRHIVLASGSGITASGAGTGKLNLVLRARAAGGTPGTIDANNATVTTNGGHVWLGGGAAASETWLGLTVGNGAATSTASTGDAAVGVFLRGGTTITTAGGSVAASGLSSYSAGTASDIYGLVMDNARITTVSGSISLTGNVQGAYNYASGVDLRNGTALTTTSGSITLRATATATNSPGDKVLGAYLRNKTTVSSDSGAINIYGTASASSAYGTGIWLGSTVASAGDGNQASGVGAGYDVAVVSNSGNVLMDARGTNSATGNWFHGFVLLAYGNDRHLLKTGSGNITIKGYANVAKDDSSGVQFQVDTTGGALHVVSTSGDIYVQGFQQSGSVHALNNALRFTPADIEGSIRFGAVSDGAAYSGKLTFEADSILDRNAQTLRAGVVRAWGSGGIAFQPSSTASVKDLALNTFWSFGSAHSGIAIGKATETRTVTVNTALTAAGPISVQAGDLVLNADLTSTLAGAGIQLQARGNVWSTTVANALKTTGGAVTIAADTDGNDSGAIRFTQGLGIDTRVGTAATGGGAITLGGGNALGTGYAAGISAGVAEGLRVDYGLTLRSGGGDINLRGRSWAGAVGSGSGGWGVGFWNGTTSLTLDSGDGRIRIEGIARSSGSGAFKQGLVAQKAVDIRSARGAADAITLLGSSAASSGSWGVGIDLGADSPVATAGTVKLIASAAGGGITLQGQGADAAVAIRSGAQLLANGGPLRLLGTGSGALLQLANANNQWWGSAAASPVTASSSDISLQFDRFSFGGTRPNIAASGAFALQPVATSASFGQAVSTEWFTFNQNGQVIGGLVLGKPGNTGSAINIDGSGGSAATAVVVNGPVSAWGSSVTTTSPLTITGNGDVLLWGLVNGNSSLTIGNTIAKTGGGDATLTLKSAGRLSVNAGIGASGGGTGKLNMVLWADSDGNRFGGASFGGDNTLASNGGHVWIGGSATPGGSTTWNGLTVGDGASPGAYGANYNGLDLRGTFTTGGGDFYAAGKSYITTTASNWDINATGGNVVVNAGSGNVTFVGNRIDFGGIYTAGAKTTVTTTGTLAIRPYEDSFAYGFNAKGAVNGSDWEGALVSTVSGNASAETRASTVLADGSVAGLANLVIRNVASLGGLTIGKATNSSAVTVRNSLAIAGDITLFGGRIANAGSAALTSTAGSIVLDADLERQINVDSAGISWQGALTASSSAAGKGNLTLLGRGGTRVNAGNHGVLLGSGSVLTAGGDVAISGRAGAASNAGAVVGAGASVSAGRTLAIDGRNSAAVAASDSFGLRLLDGAQLSAAGALSLTGQAGTGSSHAVQILNGAAIATTGNTGNAGITLTAFNGGSIASSAPGGGSGNNTAATVTAGAGSGITLAADRLDIVASRPLTLAASGVLAIEPAGANFAATTFTWDGSLAGGHFSGAGSLANIKINNLAGLGGLRLGKAGNTSNITVSAALATAGPVQLFGHDLALNAAVVASGNATAADNRIVLTAGGNVTQNAALAANGLGLQGGGRFTLEHVGNDVAVLAAGSNATPVGRVSVVDANGLAIGSVGGASGVTASGSVRVETLAGNLAINAAVASAATGTDAVVLNAGRAKGVADGDFLSGAGGNITLANGATVTTGSGGRATLYSGSPAGSTGLVPLVGSGSGRFRYASDEVTANYLTPLGSGLQAVYREQPTATLKGVAQSVVYGSEPLLAVAASGLQSGDTVAQGIARLPAVTLLDGATPAARNATGYVAVRRDGNGAVAGYGMALSRNAVSALGYALAYDDSATTTVTPKALAAVINDDAKFVGLADTPGYAGATFSGFVRGESAAHVSAASTIVRSGMGASQGVADALGSYAGALTGSVTVTAGNYTLDPSAVTAGTFHIVDPNTLLVRVGSASAVYGGPAAYDVTQVRYYDNSAHAEVALVQGSSEFHWTRGGNAGQAVDFTLAAAGANVGLHGISGSVTTPHTLPGSGSGSGSGSMPNQLLVIGSRLAVTPRTLTLAAGKVYDGSDTLTSHLTLGNLAAGETLTVTEAHASDRNATTAGNHVRQLTLADGSGLAANYQLPSLSAHDATTNSVTVTPRPLGVAVDKVYDGLASATAAQTTLTNLAAGEALAVQAVLLSNAHVATAGKHVSALTVADNGPFLAANYSLPSLAAAGAGNAVGITPKALTVAITASSNTAKTYDGSTAAGNTFSATLAATGFVAGDSATLGGYTAAYDTKTVDATRIRLSGVGITALNTTVGSVASDYALDSGAAFVAGSIAPRGVSAATAANPTKVYDGSNSVDGAVVALTSATSSTGKVAGDDLRIVAIGGTFSSADAGTGRSYTLADITLAGADARNYVLASGTITGSDGVVTPRPLTLSTTKVYDGSTALGSVTLGNLASGEYLTVSAAAAGSARVGGPDGNVATADNFVASITLANVLDGATLINKTANYSLPGSSSGVTSGAVATLNAAAGNSAVVTPAPLAVALAETQVAKVYDATTAAAAGYTPGWVLTGLVSGDSAATLTQAGAFNAASVAGASSFTLSNIALASVSGSNGSLGSDYALSATTLILPGSISARPLAVDTGGVRKTYDATTGFANLAIGLVAVGGNADSGLIAGDAANVAVVASGGGFDSKDAGSGKSYSLTGLSLAGSAAPNYRIASGDSLSGLNGIVDAKQVQVSGLSAVTKAYDGGTVAAAYGGAAGTLLTVAPGGNTGGDGRVYTGDDVALLSGPTSGAYDSKNAGAATRVDYSGFVLAGADAGNYVAVGSASATVTPKALTAGTTLAAKTYDASTAAAVTGTTLSGLVGSETLAVSTTATLDNAHAGSRTATLVHTLGNGSFGGLAANYSLAGSTQAVTVAARALTISGTTVAGKTYDATTSAAVTAGTLSGLVAGESLGVSAVGTFDSKDAGSRSASVAYTLADGSGGLASDYSLAGQSGFAATIARQTVTLTAGKTYDGTTGLGGAQLTLGGFVGSETLAYSGAAASNAHVATAGKFVVAVTLVDGNHGGLAANYQLPALNAANAPVTIGAQALTASAAIGGTLSKTYDGRTTASGASIGGSVAGAVAGDTVVLDTAGITLAYDSAHAAAATQIAGSGSIGFAIAGSSHGSVASDYSFSAPALAAVPASIAPKMLTATLANSGVAKVYDGSSAAPSGFVPLWSVSGLVAGDSAASLAHASAAYDSKDVATATKVTVGGVTLAGVAGSNGSLPSDYALAAGSADAAATITARALTLAGSKTYDGTAALSGAQVAIGNLVGSETLLFGSAVANSAHVAGSGKFISAIALIDGSGGGLAANYRLPALNAANAPVTIVAKQVTATAAIVGPLVKAYDGTAATVAAVSGSVTGSLAGDTLALDTSGVALAYDAAHVAAATQVAASGSVGLAITASSHGSLPGDYAFSAPAIAAVPASITPKTVVATLANAGTSKAYDGSPAAPAGFTSNWSISGLLAGDSAASLQHAPAVYDSKDVAAASKVTVAGIALAGIGGSNGSATSDYALAATSADAPASITPKTLTLAAGKTYDGTAALSAAQITLGSLVGSETLGLAGATASDAHVATPGKHIATLTLLDGNSGGVAGNYRLPALDAAHAPVVIAPKPLTASAAFDGPLAKAYDGSTATAVAIVGTVAGAVAGDVLVIDVGNAVLAYDSAHVAAASQIAATGSVGFAVAGSSHGSLASDYAFTAPAIAAVPAQITPRTLTATLANTAVTKAYDGSTAAPAGFAPLWLVSGLAAGDTAASLAHAGAAYDSKDVAAASRLAVDGIALASIAGSNGSAVGDYALASTAADVPAAIVPKTLAIEGLAARGKTYDGTAIAPIADWGRVATGVGSETLLLTAGSAAFADANAGSGKTVTASGYLLANGSGSGGGLAANYALAATTASTTADIARALLTVVANNDAKFVTQADPAGYAGVGYAGFVNGETAAVLGGSVTVARSNAGAEAAGSYAAVLTPDVSGLQSANYRFATQPGNFIIVPAQQLLVRVAPASSVYGSNPGYTVTSASYFDGSNVHLLALSGSGNRFTASDGAGGSATFTVAATGAALSPAGLLPVGAWQLAAADVATTNAQNFNDSLTLVGSQAVTPKPLSASIAAGIVKVYDGSTAMNGVVLDLTGLEAGDRVQLAGNGRFAIRNAGTGIGYTVADLVLGGSEAGNYRLAGGASFSGSDGVITPRPLAVAYTGLAKVYDGSTAATVATHDDRVAGDALSVVWSAAFADKNVGAGKALTVSGVALGGADAGNYTVASGGQASADIARLASVTWTGGTVGNWFDPANWRGGAVPDLANVADVVVPGGTVVTFDTGGSVAPAQAGPVQIDGLGSGGSLVQRNGELRVGNGGVALTGFTQHGGQLDSRGSVQLGRFVQTGGSTVGGAGFTVQGGFDQSGSGTLAVRGDARIASTDVGGVRIGNITVAGHLAVASTGGSITQAAGTALAVAGNAAFDAGSHDVLLDAAGNDFAGSVGARGRDLRIADGVGDLVLGDIAATGSLQATSVAGNLLQAGGTRIEVQGAAVLEAPAGTIAMADRGNVWRGGRSLRSRAGLQQPDLPPVLLPPPPSAVLPLPGNAPPVLTAAAGGIAVAAAGTAASAKADGGIVVRLERLPSQGDPGWVTVEVSADAALAGFSVQLPAAWTADRSSAPVTASGLLLEDGSPLPPWLHFQADERRLTASALPRAALPLRLLMQLDGNKVLISLVPGQR